MQYNCVEVSKYTDFPDAYKSLSEAIVHGSLTNHSEAKIVWINSENLKTSNIEDNLSGLDGIIVPGGFGERGIKGKLLTISFARNNNIPFLGICLGLQLFFNKSDEFGSSKGLGLIEGDVKILPKISTNTEKLNIQTIHQL